MEHKHLVFSKRMLCKYFFPVLILFCTLAPMADAGSPGPIQLTDGGADRLVYYFDTRARKSYIQLANLTFTPLTVHVQIWTVNSTIVSCEEIDFFDSYSAVDVHTYDMSGLVPNDAPPFGLTLAPDAYGFVVISLSSGPSNSLAGTMRIIDDAGYEYRANAAAPESTSTDSSAEGYIKFNNANGNSFSELIGFTYAEISPDTVYASPGVRSVFGTLTDTILIHDENENLQSCAPREFNCSDGSANIAIDLSLPNSKGDPGEACLSTTIDASNDSGYLLMPFEDFVCSDPVVGEPDGTCAVNTHFTGFIGLTNGGGSGSFDSWWEGGTTP